MTSPRIEIPVGITSPEELMRLYLTGIIAKRIEELEAANAPSLHSVEGHLQIDKAIEVFEEGEG